MPIIRHGGVIALGTRLAIVGPSSRDEMLVYYAKAGWKPSLEALNARYFVKAIAE